MVIEAVDDLRPAVGCGLAADVVATLTDHLPSIRFLPFQTADQAFQLITHNNCQLLVIDLTLVGERDTWSIAANEEERGELARPVVYVAPRDRRSEVLEKLVHERSLSQVLFQPLDLDELAYQIRRALDVHDESSVEPAKLPPQPVQLAVAALWERFRDTNLQRVDSVERAVMAARQGTLSLEDRREGERAAHKLAGAAGTFGFADASRHAQAIEQLLAGLAPLAPTSLRRLSDLTVELRRDLQFSPASHSPTAAQSSTVRGNERTARLLVVANDADLAERITADGRRRLIDVDVAVSVSQARQNLINERPDAVLVDLAPAESPDQDLAFLAELANDSPPLPVVVLTQRDSLVDRLEVASLGGSAFLQKPLSSAQILDTVSDFLDKEQRTESSILIVDDDPLILGSLQTILGAEGLRTVCLSDPLRFWDTLDETTPDLVVLDVDMPHVSGIELCKVVRNEQRWRTLPVLILTAHNDPATVQRVFAAGADDYVSKPFVGPELINRISNRLERNRLYRRLAEVDALTGVSTRRKATLALERYLSLAQRRHDPFTLAVLDVDGFKRINDRHGHAAGDEVLRRLGALLGQSFRREDVVGRWGGEEFVAGLYGLPRQLGVQRLTDVLERLRPLTFQSPGGQEFQVTFSAGVAQFPDDGTDVASLYHAADVALYRAKADGRNRVVGADPHEPPGSAVDQVDALIIVDAESLATPLCHALEVQGYRAQWVPNELAFNRILGGNPPSLGARLVVLSSHLPYLDGRTFLRKLRPPDLPKRSRVIVLSAHQNETEELEAFQLGAFDYVVNPSVPVLVQRIRRALND